MMTKMYGGRSFPRIDPARRLHELLQVLLPPFFRTLVLPAQVPKGYKGEPLGDRYHQQSPKEISSRVDLAFYDLGGEGLVYHDTMPTNLAYIDFPQVEAIGPIPITEHKGQHE